MLVQQPAQPEGVLKTTVAALAEKGHHGMTGIPNEEDLALHGPLGRPHCPQDARGVHGDLSDHGVHAADQGDCVAVVLLAEGGAFLPPLGGVRKGLEGVRWPMVVHVDRTSKGAVPVGQRHEHVIASWPDVKSVPAMAALVATSALGPKVVLPGAWEQHLLVAPWQDVLGERSEARAAQSVAHPRAGSVARDDWAMHPHAKAALLVGLRSWALREVQQAAHGATAREVGGLG
mmetsp:Transcript_75326/g.243584  ORF Transcript_75326/g.243584 Transcript_75326/m.243584 type:complete len:232 (+) Transcript_75326:734-1429(+)